MNNSIQQALVQQARENSGIVVVWLYGSRAKGTAHRRSDYDLAIAFQCFIDNDPIERRLRPECLALDWQQALGLHDFQLSIVDINQVPIPLAWEVIQANKVLYSCDDNRLWQEIRRIHSRMALDYER